ncbi:MAG: sigma-54-dependent Fis family transcriptional regulator [Deltaproteobacteria bacterium]|nr:sigma-54-dependent Fis family transcriptional regulator [Deltaproteobacteria bacterium]
METVFHEKQHRIEMSENNHSKVVILDPAEPSRDYLRLMMSGWGYPSFCFDRQTICLDNLQELDPALVILKSLSLSSASRMIHAVKTIAPGLPALVISNDTATENALVANGFEDVLVAFPDSRPEILRLMVHDLLARRKPDTPPVGFPQVVGNSPVMLKIKRLISELGRSTEAVLLRGEPGTGKELIARAIHLRSPRVKNPFVKIDCTLMDDGWNRAGLFPPARPSKNGNTPGPTPFGDADQGTLFLKEIGLIPPALQNELLLIVEEGAVTNPGSRTKRKVNIRILASSSRDLDRLVQKGWFRKDLFFRLNVFAIDIPNLTDRREDIPLLMDFFADRFCSEKEVSHIDIVPEGKRLFEQYRWPGNVRELETQVHRILSEDNRQWRVDGVRANGPLSGLQLLHSTVADIDAWVDFSEIKSYVTDLHNLSLKQVCNEFVFRVEKRLMETVLEYTHWNRKKAAAMLDISYKSLLNKIRDYGVQS